MPEFVVPEPNEPFQSEQIYGWIEQLCVRSYKDLLAPHWSAHDRAVPTERFDPERYTRSGESKVGMESRAFPLRAKRLAETRRSPAEAVRPGAEVRIAARDPGPLLERAAPTSHGVSVIIVDRSARSEVTARPPAQRPPLVDRIRQVLAGWRRRLLVRLARSRG
jgi:hypothetical protein